MEDKEFTLMLILEMHFFKDKDNNYWCERIVDYNFLKRYLKVFDKVKVCARVTQIDKASDRMLLSSGNNVSFIELPEFGNIKELAQKYSKIIRIVKDNLENIDACAMRAPSHLSLVMRRLLEHKKVPYLVEFVGAADRFIKGNSFIVKILNDIIEREAKMLCKNANAVSYVTERVLQEECPSHHRLFPKDKNYIESNYSTVELSKENYYYDENKEKPEILKIVHTGYMDTDRKGQNVVIEVLKKLVDKGITNVHVEFIGDGKARPELEKMVEDYELANYVEFKGLVTKQAELMEELRKSDLLVFPTRKEGLPRTVIEAMASGLPCISTPVDGIPELLEEEFLIERNNIDRYVTKIEELMNDWEKLKKVGKENYIKVQKYEKSVLDKKRTEFYDEFKKIVLELQTSKK